MFSFVDISFVIPLSYCVNNEYCMAKAFSINTAELSSSMRLSFRQPQHLSSRSILQFGREHRVFAHPVSLVRLNQQPRKWGSFNSLLLSANQKLTQGSRLLEMINIGYFHLESNHSSHRQLQSLPHGLDIPGILLPFLIVLAQGIM